jgi:hypothetical protein
VGPEAAHVVTVYRVANLAYQLPDDHDLIRRLRDGTGFDEPADVLLLVEARDADNQPLDVAKALGRGWSVSQDRSNGATAGSVIAVRRETVRLRWSLSRLLSRKGRKVQDRYQRVGAVRPKRASTARINVLHNPLRSTGRQEEAVANARRWVDRQNRRGKRWMVAGDFNMDANAMRIELGGARSFGADVMGIVLSGGWGDVDFSKSHYKGSDHAVLTMTTRN